MIARIIPLKRLPKALHIFDYIVPESLSARIAVGQLVIIPVRSSHIYGVVLSVGEQKDGTYTGQKKELIDIVNDEPLLSASHLHALRILAKWYGVSTGTIAKMSVLPLQKRKLTKMELAPLPARSQKPPTGTQTCEAYADEAQHAALLGNTLAKNGQTLIVVPTVQHIKEVQNLLSEDILVWHGELTVKQQFDHWLKIRNGEAKVIVGTRTATLLPFFNLQSICIDFEHDEYHKHADQAPRFHAHDTAELLRRIHGATISRISFSLRISSTADIPVAPSLQPTIVDISSQRSMHAHDALSLPVQDAIKETKGDVFLFLNRRGYGRSLMCGSCGWTASCESCHLPYTYYREGNVLKCNYCQKAKRPPTACEKCESPVIKLRGFGTEMLTAQVKELLGEAASHQVIRADGDVNNLPSRDDGLPAIIVGTEMAFSRIDWKKISMMVFIDVDRELALPEYTAGERVWHRMQEVFYRAPDAEMYIQTRRADHPVFLALTNPESWYREERERRKLLGYPPDTFLVRYLYADKKKDVAKDAVELTHQRLLSTLTQTPDFAKVSEAYALHPQFYRNKYWYGMLVRLPVETWPNDIIKMNALFGPGWKIDPHPESILSA